VHPFINSPSASDFAKETPSVVEFLKNFKLPQALKLIAGLSLNPALQSNAYRIEMMVHLALSFSDGQKGCKKNDVSHFFSLFAGSFIGMQEDPVDDLFVTSIATLQGNLLCLQGIWECGGFYIQRVLNVLEQNPHVPGLREVLRAVYALLKVSDLICRKAKLDKYKPQMLLWSI
jgi:hypothetical protein